MKENKEFEENIEEEKEFAELEKLKASAPDDIFIRLQKRTQMAQLGKDLVERQAFAFWSVIDAFLRLMFVPKRQNEENPNTGEKQ